MNATSAFLSRVIDALPDRRFNSTAIAKIAELIQTPEMEIADEETIGCELDEWHVTKDVESTARDMGYEADCDEMGQDKNPLRDVVDFIENCHVIIFWTGNEWVYRNE